MDWTKVAESVAASGPLAGVLLAAVWVLWKRGIDREDSFKQQLAAKDTEIARLNSEQHEFLRELMLKNEQ